MVNTLYLDEMIKKSGKSKTFLSSKIGCSRQYFHMKCRNEAPFTLCEADILCSELGITKLTDKEKIFFSK